MSHYYKDKMTEKGILLYSGNRRNYYKVAKHILTNEKLNNCLNIIVAIVALILYILPL